MRKIILSFAACLALAAYGQKPVQDTRAMDTFIDQLMGKMTLDEKIGQLPTGQVQLSDLLLQSHLTHQLIDKRIHRSRILNGILSVCRKCQTSGE